MNRMRWGQYGQRQPSRAQATTPCERIHLLLYAFYQLRIAHRFVRSFVHSMLFPCARVYIPSHFPFTITAKYGHLRNCIRAGVMVPVIRTRWFTVWDDAETIRIITLSEPNVVHLPRCSVPLLCLLSLSRSIYPNRSVLWIWAFCCCCCFCFICWPRCYRCRFSFISVNSFLLQSTKAEHTHP